MATKLDRSRDFGEVTGGGPTRYVQDGKNFDPAGNEVVVVGAPPLKAPAGSGIKSGSGVKKATPAAAE